MAHVLTQPRAQSKISVKLSALGKKLVTLAVSYEVLTYCLATVQAAGLTLPTMVHGGRAEVKAQVQRDQQKILNAAMQWKQANYANAAMNPQFSDLKAFLAQVPVCPEGGRYEIVYPGQEVQVQDQTIIVPEGRLAVRAVHNQPSDLDQSASLFNPYQ